MSGPYFQKQSWPAFTYQGQTYDFTHLDEHEVEVNDSGGTVRRIAISFSDHCFTREPETGDDPGLRYLDSTRPTGYFCLERYQLSLGLSRHIAHAMPQLSGYKSNRFNWLEKDGSGSCDFDSLNT